MEQIEQRIEDVVDAILSDYRNERDIDRLDLSGQPDKETVMDITAKLQRIVFPGYSREKNYRTYNAKHNLSMLIEDVMYNLSRQIARVTGSQEQGSDLCLQFLQTIPAVRAAVQTDLQAAFDGDPAATSKDEIVFSYPGMFAITVYRLAHELYKLNVPMIPRMMTEHAHSLTGIDIHPGATIGKYFFIDHGQSRRGKKRHPTIEDNVTIYANAAILGGNTVIGAGCVIGSSTFITESIAPCTTVTVKTQELQLKPRGNCCEGCEGRK